MQQMCIATGHCTLDFRLLITCPCDSQREEGVVCVKVCLRCPLDCADCWDQHGENIEVNVYNDTSDELIELHGKWQVLGPLHPLLKHLQGGAARAIGRQPTVASWQVRHHFPEQLRLDIQERKDASRDANGRSLLPGATSTSTGQTSCSHLPSVGEAGGLLGVPIADRRTSIPGCSRAARFCLADRFRKFQVTECVVGLNRF